MEAQQDLPRVVVRMVVMVWMNTRIQVPVVQEGVPEEEVGVVSC
jgi:hypothetical protein